MKRYLLILLAMVLRTCGTSPLSPSFALGAEVARPPVPGATDPRVTQANIHQTICQPGYTASVRKVPVKMKVFIYRRDGRKPKRGVCCEIDHVISLELGGSNVAQNLWAEPYKPIPGAHEKDAVEDRLHAMVCGGEITLAEAQKAISRDWYAEYRKRYGAAK